MGRDTARKQDADTNTAAFAQSLVRDRMRSFWHGAPLTALHLGLGAASHALALLGLVPLRAQSFHPRLALGPAWQLHRVPWSVLVLGRSIPQAVASVVSLVTWHAQLEALVCGSGDTVKDGRIVKRGTNGRSKKTTFQWLVKDNTFLHIQLATLVAATALEMLLYADPKDPLSAVYLSGSSVLSSTQRAVLVFPYSLFPVFDAAIRWTWAFMELEKDTLIFGVIPVRPIYVPIATSLLGGTSFFNLFKGFLIATAVSTALKLQRGGKDFQVVSSGGYNDVDGGVEDEPEFVWEFLRDFGFGWYRWIKAAGRKLLNIKATADAAASAAGKKPSSSSSSSSNNNNRRPSSSDAFDVNDASTFFDATVLPAIGPFVAEARDALVRAANEMVDLGNENNRVGAPSSSSSSGARRRPAAASAASRRAAIEEDVQMEDLEEGSAGGYSVFGSSASVSRI
ncbi:hypothetical protein BDR26DRAFT_856467 [Obelidium mucronatum]|nr:hypothetical protein BDR26DRAFT_856467 [Obelidium mucronatum]